MQLSKIRIELRTHFHGLWLSALFVDFVSTLQKKHAKQKFSRIARWTI